MFVDVNGALLHAVELGSGPRTIVATGGWTGSWEVWEEPLGMLSTAGWRCIAYDHRGSGESPVDPALISVNAMVDDVGAILDAFGVESCVLAGESQGGAIAQYAALRFPARIEGLVLSAPAPTGRREVAPADACRNDYPAVVEGFVARCFPEPDIDHVRRWATNVLLRADGEQAARIIEMWGDADVPEVDATHIRARTLIIHGTADAIVPIDVSRALAAVIPDVELLELEGSGHVPTMTRSREVVDAIVSRFASL